MKEIKWGIWPGSVYLIIGEKDITEAKRILDDSVIDQLTSSTGVGVTCSSGVESVIFLRDTSISTIVHEGFHAVVHIMNQIGMRLSDESDEAYSYSLQYLIEEINKEVIKDKSKLHKKLTKRLLRPKRRV